jgi:hypothetical protein
MTAGTRRNRSGIEQVQGANPISETRPHRVFPMPAALASWMGVHAHRISAIPLTRIRLLRRPPAKYGRLCRLNSVD